MELVLFVLFTALLGLAADRWGIDTREFVPPERRRGSRTPDTLL